MSKVQSSITGAATLAFTAGIFKTIIAILILMIVCNTKVGLTWFYASVMGIALILMYKMQIDKASQYITLNVYPHKVAYRIQNEDGTTSITMYASQVQIMRRAVFTSVGYWCLIFFTLVIAFWLALQIGHYFNFTYFF